MCSNHGSELRTKLDEKDLKFLSDHLEQHCDMSLVQLHGFLTAISSLPLFITPDQWLFDLKLLAGPDSNGELDRVINVLEVLQISVLDDLEEDELMPPFYEESESDEAKKQVLTSWAEGYLLALGTYAEDEDSILINEEVSANLFLIESLTMTDDELLEIADGSRARQLAMLGEIRYNATNISVLMSCVQKLSELWFQGRQENAEKKIAELQARFGSLEAISNQEVDA